MLAWAGACADLIAACRSPLLCSYKLVALLYDVVPATSPS